MHLHMIVTNHCIRRRLQHVCVYRAAHHSGPILFDVGADGVEAKLDWIQAVNMAASAVLWSALVAAVLVYRTVSRPCFLRALVDGIV